MYHLDGVLGEAPDIAEAVHVFRPTSIPLCCCYVSLCRKITAPHPLQMKVVDHPRPLAATRTGAHVFTPWKGKRYTISHGELPPSILHRPMQCSFTV